MRVLITASPGIGHNFPLVPTAWALRAQGHEVLWVTSGQGLEVAKAGMQVADPAPEVNAMDLFAGFFERHPEVSPTSTEPFVLGAKLFAYVSAAYLDGSLAIAKAWRPDLVLHSPLQAGGPLIGAALGVPTVCHSFSSVTADPKSQAILTEEFGAEYARLGVTPQDSAGMVAVAPPSMAEVASQGWQIRYVPYNAGAVLPEWLTVPAERPRIVVTLGSVFADIKGTGILHDFLESAGKVDAEFVLALNGVDSGPLPDNARVVEWLPLSAVLPTCTAAIHHGGAGTTLSIVDAGIPQLVLPQGADHHFNADDVERAGIGYSITKEELTVDRVADLLADEKVRESAVRVAEEMHALPTPAELVPKLAALV